LKEIFVKGENGRAASFGKKQITSGSNQREEGGGEGANPKGGKKEKKKKVEEIAVFRRTVAL